MRPVSSERIAVRILKGSVNDIPMESLHIYVDPVHNRELIYNEDDIHVMLEVEEEPGSKYIRAEAIQAYQSRPRAVRYLNEDGSWSVITTVAARNEFSAAGVHTKMGPNITYGFDLGVGSSDDPEKRFYWQGNAQNDTDTSHFGSILLVE